jgi:plastocyanin domain-containing protein
MRKMNSKRVAFLAILLAVILSGRLYAHTPSPTPQPTAAPSPDSTTVVREHKTEVVPPMTDSTPKRSGEFAFRCGMNMHRGKVIVQ